MDESPCEPGDWEQIDVGSTSRDIQDKCEEKGLWGVDVEEWHTTTKTLTVPGPDVRAMVARWTESDRDSIIRIIKEGSETRYLENPDLDESKCVFIVLGQRETFLIVGPLRMQYVRKKLSRILH